VTWRQTFAIGCQILAAGWRTRLRFRRSESVESGHPEKALVAQPQRGS
jgi:hypothetical protein